MSPGQPTKKATGRNPIVPPVSPYTHIRVYVFDGGSNGYTHFGGRYIFKAQPDPDFLEQFVTTTERSLEMPLESRFLLALNRE